MQKRIILDINSKELLNNRAFDIKVAEMVDSIPLYVFAQNAKRIGYEVMTADVFLRGTERSGINLLITEIFTHYTERLISQGCVPAICYCGESPLVIPGYYHNLKKKIGRFKHAYLFKGAHHSYDAPTQKKHVLYWTNAQRSVDSQGPWDQRKFLTLINSNKHSSKPFAIRKIADLKIWSDITLHYLKNWIALHTFPGNIPDFYSTRLCALQHFSKKDDFELFGQGWNNEIFGVSQKSQDLIRRSYRGAFPRGNAKKHKILRNYKFALCFENTAFSGYVTEKIFDCILCGVIPVYLGAPDIDAFVPREIYIDFNFFSSFEDLENYLRTLSLEEINRYLNSASDFVASESFEKYYLSGWGKSTLASIQDAASTL
jgi:hypothetical protein